jgi:hypothetical protein
LDAVDTDANVAEAAVVFAIAIAYLVVVVVFGALESGEEQKEFG